MRRIVVVGASLAGLRAAETLRAEGYAGELVMAGDEPHLPYNRPPLSKAALVSPETARGIALAGASTLSATWRLGSAVVALDSAGQTVSFGDGATLDYDGLVIATGARPRVVPALDTDLEGVFVLRSLDDAKVLAAHLRRSTRLVVVGAGFIGSEVASTARAQGLGVTLVEAGPLPLIAQLGPELARWCAERHRRAGIDLRLGVQACGLLGDEHVRGVQLADGTVVAADVVVLGLGAVPNVEWIAGSGLRLDDGVVCDSSLFAEGADGVVAAGDVARWPHPLRGGERIRLEHWANAVDQGVHAARSLLRGRAHAEPFRGVPSFWSDQHGARIESVGLPEAADAPARLMTDARRGSAIATYERAGTLIGAVAFNARGRLAAHRAELARVSVTNALDTQTAI